jgi:hypothetical protein
MLCEKIKSYQISLSFSICDKIIRKKYNRKKNLIVCLDHKDKFIIYQTGDILNNKDISPLERNDGSLGGARDIKKIIIPEGVKSLGDDCFNRCSKLESIVIPEGVKSLGNDCFSCCSELRSIVIPEGVESLGYFCFSSCSKLESIVIPKSVKSLRYACFWGCSKLESITIFKNFKFDRKLFPKEVKIILK